MGVKRSSKSAKESWPYSSETSFIIYLVKSRFYVVRVPNSYSVIVPEQALEAVVSKSTDIIHRTR